MRWEPPLVDDASSGEADVGGAESMAVTVGGVCSGSSSGTAGAEGFSASQTSTASGIRANGAHRRKAEGCSPSCSKDWSWLNRDLSG